MSNSRCNKIFEDILFNNMNYAEREINKFNRRFKKYKINFKLSIEVIIFENVDVAEDNINLVIKCIKAKWEQRKIKKIFNAGNIKKRGRL